MGLPLSRPPRLEEPSAPSLLALPPARLVLPPTEAEEDCFRVPLISSESGIKLGKSPISSFLGIY